LSKPRISLNLKTAEKLGWIFMDKCLKLKFKEENNVLTTP
jgi:hypothetical protein